MSQFFVFDHEKYRFQGQIYLVGGPVRDHLLSLEAHDRDWLVVGSTPEQMKAAGFVQVGKDFPVFLHPQTKEEYALARTERKSGQGYQGFVCHASPEVTLEEDLIRRDFTINAMAIDEAGELHDPYGGRRDLEARVLRHVSPAFAEDPLRVLRGARFLARLAYLGFTLADETRALMTDLVRSGELEHLSAERVWSETERALAAVSPEQYFHTLQQVGALDVWFAELAACPVAKPLPEYLADKPNRALYRWAFLLQELDTEQIETLSARLKLPKRYLDFARLHRRHRALLNREPPEDAEACLAFLEASGAFKQGGMFEDWLQIWSPQQEAQRDWWRRLADQLAEVTAKMFVQQGLKGAAIGAAIRAQRLALTAQALTAR